MPRLLILAALLLAAMLLAGCAEESTASDAIADYLKAQVGGDADQLVKLACPAYEADARADAASFKSVDASIEDLKCSSAGKDGDYTLVECTGTIVIQYRGEDPRSQSLPAVTYRAIEQDGDWKMCGKQE